MKSHLKELYCNQNGFLKKDEIDNCSLNELEDLIFDAFKSNNCQDFSSIDILYQLIQIRYALKQKKRYYLGIFPNMEGGGLPKSQNFWKFTKYFFVCQIHSEVLKHVLQMGG